MNSNPNKFLGVLKCVTVFWIAVAVFASPAVVGQTIPNPSFEADQFTVAPGFVSGNTPITGWTANPDFYVGLNPAGGSSTFADNGLVPDGANVAFIQQGGTLSTTISGLTAGQAYKVTFRANAQTPPAADQYPYINASIGFMSMWDITIYNVSGTNPYAYLAFEFTATAPTETLTLANDSSSTMTTTVMVDDFKIAPSGGRWSVVGWNGDADSDVDANFVYTHAYNFASAASPVINEVAFTGVEGGNPAVVGKFSTAFFGNVFPGDGNSITVLGGNSSAVLARDFLYGGTIAPTNSQSINLEGLTPGTEYVMTIYSVGWENPGPTIRWVTVGVGDDRLTINQDQFYDNNGIRISYRYTADASGTATLKISPVNPNNVSMHVYGFSNREAVSRNVAPEIAIQPQPANTIVAQGVPITYTVFANGIPAPTYQWRFNGVNVTGANGTSYTIPAASVANIGNYDVVARNSMGSVTSVVVRVSNVGMLMTNPSFEADLFSVFPGYVSGNFPITGWTSLGNHGINPTSDGQSPFADNGIIPNGSQVAFMQGDGALSQAVSGFVVGGQYVLHYYENSRAATATPALEVRLGPAGFATNVLVPVHMVPAVGGGLYREVYSEMFTATATELEVSFIKSNPLGGDSTALVDNVAFLPIAAGTAPYIVRSPDSRIVEVGDSTTFNVQAIGSLPLAYQWLKNGEPLAGAAAPALTLTTIQKPDQGDYSVRISNSSGAVTSLVARLTVFEPVPGLFSTGVGDNRVALADGLADPHFALIENPDTNSTVAIVEDSTVFPIVTGPWLANTTRSKWIGPRVNTAASAVGRYVYRITFNLTDRDPSKVVILGRWATDNAGPDIQLNGVSTGNPANGSFAAYTPFAIYGTNANFLPGTNTLDFVVENLAAIGYTGLRVDLQSDAPIPPGVRPEITGNPVSQTVVEGDTVTFAATAQGAAPLTYQWNKNGEIIPGQTGLTLTLSNVTTAANGSYTITVVNSAGTATSAPAQLLVGYRGIPGAFGTGVGTDGTLLPGAAIDPHWILASSVDPLFPGPNAIVLNDVWPVQQGVWLVNGPNSKWIAPWENQNDQPGFGGGNDGGEYVYQTTVNLAGYDITKVHLVGAWATDNSGTDIKVNGISTGLTCPGFNAWSPFGITNGLIAGANVLDFVMSNATNATVTPNPTGLRVDLRALLNIAQAAPKLQIGAFGNNAVISWSPVAAGQKLQFAPAVSGPWNDVSNQTNPYTNAATGTQFFRVFTP